MTALFLFDDARARRFEPFSLTRPVCELRAGALRIRERWELACGIPASGFVSGPHVADFDERGAPSAVRSIPSGAIVASSRFAPALARVALDASRFRADGRTVAVRLGRAVEGGELRDGGLPLDELPRTVGRDVEMSGEWLNDVWSLVATVGSLLRDDIPVLASRMRRVRADEALLIGDAGVHADEGAIIEPHSCFDTTHGPVLVGRGATVQAFTRVVGPCYVGDESLVTCDRVGGSAIGPHCKVHGELSASVLLAYANKGHDGFVGHSYLGSWTNLGAGTITSNLKNTYGTVALWTPDGMRDTGMQFLGTLLGDHAKTGVNVALTTGSVIGAGANIVGRTPPKVVAPFAWGESGAYETYRLEKFLDVAERVMARRSVTMTARVRQQLTAAHAARWST